MTTATEVQTKEWTKEKLSKSIYKNDWLLYTTSDEDSESELKALQIGADDTVLVITGSGCRTLALLADSPQKVISVDANPHQNFLLELKMEAMRRLEHGAYLEFLGVRKAKNRLATYRQIEPQLSTPAIEFWQRHLDKIEDGLIFLGKHEQFYKKYLGSLLFRPKRGQFREMLKCQTIEEQRQYFHEKWDTWFWRWTIRTFSNPKVFEIALGDPSYFNQVGAGDSIGDYLLNQMKQSFTTHLVRDNHFLTFLFLGEYMNEDAMPVYLQKKYFERIKKNLDRVEIVTDRLDTYLAAQPRDLFDKVSLSDISGWIPEAEFSGILTDVVRTIRRDGRFCYRNFLAKRSIPPHLQPELIRDDQLIEQLNQEDKAFAFTFEIAQKR